MRSDSSPKPDEIDEAIARYWNPPTLDELMADVKPITSWDDPAISDLTDAEWKAFEAALKDV